MQRITLTDYQNGLHELGCDAELTGEIISLLQNGQPENAALLLRRYKHLLLAELHKAEKKVDLLDYLLYQLKNAENK